MFKGSMVCFVSCLGLILMCCSKSSQLSFPVSEQGDSCSLTDSIHSFSGTLYQTIAKQMKPRENIVVSPLSIFTALLMTWMGADGCTLERIESTLHFPVSESFWHEDMAKLQVELQRVTYKLDKLKEVLKIEGCCDTCSIRSQDFDSPDLVAHEMLNEVSVSKSSPVKEEYSKLVARIFQSGIEDAVLTDDLSVHNRYSNTTQVLIQDDLPNSSLTRDSLMVIANTLAFKGTWQHLFYRGDTANETFFVDAGRPVQVPIMQVEAFFKIAKFSDLKATAIFLPYKGTRYGLLILLPFKRIGIEETEKRLFELDYTSRKLLRGMQYFESVFVKLPKFKISFQREVTGVFQQMGLDDLLSPFSDLSGMSSTLSPIFPKEIEVAHQCFLEVNEEGTHATDASISLKSGLLLDESTTRFIADRPFLYYLVDQENDAIPLYAGRLVNPLST